MRMSSLRPMEQCMKVKALLQGDAGQESGVQCPPRGKKNSTPTSSHPAKQVEHVFCYTYASRAATSELSNNNTRMASQYCSKL